MTRNPLCTGEIPVSRLLRADRDKRTSAIMDEEQTVVPRH